MLNHSEATSFSGGGVVLDFNHAPRLEDLKSPTRKDEPAPFEIMDFFRAELEGAFAVVDGEIEVDGEWHRLDDVDKPRERDVTYRAFMDGRPNITIKNRRRDLEIVAPFDRYDSGDVPRFDPVQAEARKLKQEDTRRARWEEAAEKARQFLAKCSPAQASNPYLQAKGVEPCPGLLQGGGVLVVPMRGADGEVCSYQTIDPPGHGGKRFLKGGRKGGSFFTIPGKDDAPICLVEGLATGLSVNAATGFETVVAFDADNLVKVAPVVREQHPARRIVIAADNDCETEGNPGVTKAHKAQETAGGDVVVVVPALAEGQKCDFNDVHAAQGIETVREQIVRQTEAAEREKPSFPSLFDWFAHERLTGDIPDPGWLVRGVFPLGKVTLLGAAGGVGKSFMLLQMARAIAMGGMDLGTHFGGQIEKTGAVAFLTAEDSAFDLDQRLLAMGGSQRGEYPLITMPFPDVGGAPIFFENDGKGNPQTTEAWAHYCNELEELKRRENLAAVIVDPLQTFCSLELNCPQLGQFVMSRLNSLAARLDISTILSHHFKKTDREIESLATARSAIRGSTALVDGARSVYAMYPAPAKDSRKILECTGLKSTGPDCIIHGGVVKLNGKRHVSMSTFYRTESGLLQDITSDARNAGDKAYTVNVILQMCEDDSLHVTPKGPKNNAFALWEQFTKAKRPPRKFVLEVVDEILEDGLVENLMGALRLTTEGRNHLYLGPKKDDGEGV